MASAWTLQLHTVSSSSFPLRFSKNVVETRAELGFSNGYKCWNRKINYAKFVVRASSDAADDEEDNKDINNIKDIQDDDAQLIVAENEKSNEKPAANWRNLVPKFQETFVSLPPIIFLMKRQSGTNFAIALCIAATLLVIAVRGYMARKKRPSRPGSVADLVRRGQVNSDRRGISSPLKYEDPFNNPMVKVSKSNSTVEMCGKVYRLAPVSLTKEQQAIHKKRRSRAYQWKRPTIFLREGDPVPPDVDPDTIRWIPANHPFATTVSDIDEGLAQTNVYQKHGVPFRIKAEHEALQKRLESLQNDQKLGKLVIDSGAATEFERPFKSNLRPEDPDEQNPTNDQVGSNSNPTTSDRAFDSLPKKPVSEDTQQP